jgi:hypothetical protein
MKQAILAVSICLLLVGTIGTAAAGAVAAPLTGKSCNCCCCYDVLGPDGKICGKITIDMASGKFICNCYGLTPGKEWKLVYHVTGLMGSAFITSGIANPSGAVHLMGTLDQSKIDLLKRPGEFSVVLYVP